MALKEVKICDLCPELATNECAACGKDLCAGLNTSPPLHDGGHSVSIRLMMRNVHTMPGDMSKLSTALLHLCRECVLSFGSVSDLPKEVIEAASKAVADAIKADLAKRALTR